MIISKKNPEKKTVKVKTPETGKGKRYAYDPGKKNIKTELICKFCGAVYEEKKWKAIDQLNPKFVDKLHEVVCPACHAAKSLVSDGTVHLTGTFINRHKEELMNIIKKIEEKEMARDILNRIERIESMPNEISVYTSKNQLATEIGKKVSNDFKGGNLEIKFSKKDKPVEVRWHKDIEEENQ